MRLRSLLTHGALRLCGLPGLYIGVVLGRKKAPVQSLRCRFEPRAELCRVRLRRRFRGGPLPPERTAAMAARGHFDPFPPRRLNGWCPFSQPTSVGASGNGKDACALSARRRNQRDPVPAKRVMTGTVDGAPEKNPDEWSVCKQSFAAAPI